MTPSFFVAEVRKVIVDENNELYRTMFESKRANAVSDSYWKRAFTLYQSLGESERSVLLEIMRQTTIDTVSNLFGILDGTSVLNESQEEEFILTTLSDDKRLNGTLQDLFLEADECGRR